MIDNATASSPRPVAEEIDLLMKEYAILKSDQNMQAQSFKNHVRNAQILLAIIAGLVSVLLSTAKVDFTDNFKWEWVGFSFVLTIVTYFLVYDTLEANFAVQALAERIASIEERVNQLLHRRALVWESTIAKKLWTPWHINWIIHPIPLLLLHQGTFIVLMATFTIGVYVWAWRLPTTTCPTKILLALLIAISVSSFLFAIYAWFAINHFLRREVRRLINEV